MRQGGRLSGMGIRSALLVGTAQYRDPTLSRLRAPAQDARRLAELLRDPAIGRFDSVQVLVDPRKQEIDEEIENLFAERSPGDLVLLYLACHGVKSERGRLFFAAATTELSRLNSTAVSAAYVNEIMEQSRAGMKVAMLDCCFSGAYARGLTPRSGADEQLAQQIAGRGTFVMTATDALEYAYEDGQAVSAGEEQRSVFTSSVIDGLETGDADLEGDGLITADELFGYVERRVGETGEQTPKRFCVNVSGMIPIAWVPQPGPAFPAWAGSRAGAVASCLGDLLPPVTETQDRGLCVPGWRGSGGLTVPLGLAHRPGQRDRATFGVDLSNWAGNLGVAGAPQSGKTTLLRTLICALALTHTPLEAQTYCLDFDGDLRTLAGLPHVGAVAGYLDPALAREIARMAAAVAEQRRERFSRFGIDSMRAFRVRKSRGEITEDPFGDVFLIVDGWPALIRHFAEIEEPLLRVAESGLRFGVHLAVSAPRWTDLPNALRERLTTRIELPLSDPRESEFDAGLSAEIPAGRPGCGLVRGPAFLDVCLPRIDGSRSADDLADGLADLVARVDLAWHGAPAPPAVTAPGPSTAVAPDVTLPELLGIKDLRKLPLDRLWAPRAPAERLRVPIGATADGTPVLLDLKEAAQDGMGPHGLVVGATGSGKSQLIRALVLSLALTHPPSALNFLLTDWKGGSTFFGLRDLPHVAGLAGALSDDPTGADRLAEVIQGELIRRQELLRAYNFGGIRDHERARQAGQDLSELPALIIVIDEFSELLMAQPELLETLVKVGRMGRSLGVHMVLASQRLDEGRLRGLDTLLSFRIGLRTSSERESRAVIGVPDAYRLSLTPGQGYLQAGRGGLVPFRGVYVSAYADSDAVGEFAPTVLEVAVDGLRDRGDRAAAIWLPPLTRPPTLDQLWPALPEQPAHGRLLAPVGITDRPLEHSQPPLALDLSGTGTLAAGSGIPARSPQAQPGNGNVAIVGAPSSGKSALAAALVCSLALTHSPEEVQFFLVCADGGGVLRSLAALPHVSAVTGSRGTDQERERRAVTECSRLIDRREQMFTEAGIDSFADYRGRKARGEFQEDPYGDVFLVIDGLRAIREHSGDLETGIALISQRGPACGVHVVITAERWFDIRPSVSEALATRLELRLSDPVNSRVDRKAAAALPIAPGHGLTADGTHFLSALPRDDGVADAAGLGDATAALAARCAERWPHSSAPQLRMLPRLIPYSALPEPEGDPPLRIPVGLDEELRPVFVDLEADPHFLVFGDAESGKTSFLRLLAKSITARCTPERARIMAADYRRALLDTVIGEHLIGYGASAPALSSLIADVSQAIRKRMPGPDVTAEQLRTGKWWTGPHLVLLVDDYDLVAAAANPLQPLTELLAQARDLGLHLVLTRRTAGAGRAMFDPVIQRLRELDTPGILLSGERGEGVLLGRSVRPAVQPPGRGTLVNRRTGRPITVQLAYDGQEDHATDIDPSPEEPDLT